MSKKNLLLLALSVLWCPSLPAAQDIETIIIKASRIPQPLHTIGSSVSVIDLDDWKGTDITIADVLRSVPGISINQSGGFGQLAGLRMRGGESNHTLILLDGVELSNPATGQVDFAHLTTAGIERIEILRGAQSALWGSRAVSGVINLISREGGGTTLGLESGSDQEHRFSAQTSYQSDWGGVDAGIQNFQTGGDNIAPEGEEEDGYRNTTLQWNLRWTPEPKTSLRLSMRQVHATSEYDGFDFAAGHAVDAYKKSKHRRTLLSTDLTTRTGPVEHQWNIRYLQAEDHWPGNEPQSQRLQASGLLWRAYDDCLAGRPCTIGGGVEWSKERYTRGEVGPLDFKSTSALLILKWQPETHAFLDLSFRREENQDFGDFSIWRASFAYHLSDQPARIYLTSGIGIANPTLTERFGYFPDQFEGNPDLNPERSRTVEVGFEYYPDGICCRIGLSAFTQRLSDEINGYFDPDGFEGPALPTAVNQSERSRRRGAELELGFEPHPNWAISGSYAYLDATQPGFDGMQPEVRRPRHQYRLILNHESADWQGQLDATTVRGLRDAGETLDNYWLLNLSMRRTLTPMLGLVIEVRNLLDETYEEVKGYRSPDLHLGAGLAWRFD